MFTKLFWRCDVKYAWIRLDMTCPERSLFHEEDLPDFAEWVLNYDFVNQVEVDNVVSWFWHLPIGLLVPIEGRPDYQVVKVFFQEV